MDTYIKIYVLIALLASSFCLGSAGDIVHHDDVAPKRPGCENNFVLVKVPTWINGVEDIEYVGVGARFGLTLESKEKHANLFILALADPPDCCSKLKNKLSGEVILAHRGNCSFTTKANVAEDAGASAILIINNRTELFKMVCEVNETDVKIGIASVMLPQDAGASLEKYLTSSSSVKVQLYSPLTSQWWMLQKCSYGLMAVGTIFMCFLLDGLDELIHVDGVHSSGIVNINHGICNSLLWLADLPGCFVIMLSDLNTGSLSLLHSIILLLFGGSSAISPLLLDSLEVSDHRTTTITASAGFVLTLLYGKYDALFPSLSTPPSSASIISIINHRVDNSSKLRLLYDIFWVLFQSGGSKESVMIVVTRGDKSGEGWYTDATEKSQAGVFDPWGGYSIIGVCVTSSYQDCLYDWLAKKSLRAGYFLWAMTAYGLGLLITYVALNMMDGHGQPALLYIVPFTLGTFLTLGKQRGELETLWTMGEPERHCRHIQFQPPGS
ncbi:PA DOMAIN PRESENILIN/SIGNAL PEPTIDE PEPTIDASE-RELATED [Salix viminalis]|uniref:PA DOMAIN PRESENILIN/SIGNAL PEPTIDE PEPTIDASE-RELATED n=1 Tax=Salix viminalis TaxID=40686 RepID=A0A9Q0ZCP7_SALVM|nr:PA DOMAIN PRESENILIN/SIGNAL PEPTIDE PEPTIDASE-RELATED [Salix viminalis]